MWNKSACVIRNQTFGLSNADTRRFATDHPGANDRVPPVTIWKRRIRLIEPSFLPVWTMCLDDLSWADNLYIGSLT
jgi:hypothetical protein